ncbi:hypothetical protein [Clostridium magnum]|uniref:Uncharacterized protein n=1 Tax=Clostridium magnum DSM 2767 TaxID=1121326 RepID=A0A162QT73_9CLOT|nr:hypothetical protein [Clostridium magnum]KZL88929.1 hypothetical protein CLMAG_58330 [Clostridium magnum DSM 2767]SHI53924.1 hypothetical protein SAMN02745944_04480 [Clostridium magnum DSM 2767]
MKHITIDQILFMAESMNLEVIEDIYISLTNGKKTIVINDIGCLKEPPFTTLYDEKEVQKVIDMLVK